MFCSFTQNARRLSRRGPLLQDHRYASRKNIGPSQEKFRLFLQPISKMGIQLTRPDYAKPSLRINRLFQFAAVSSVSRVIFIRQSSEKVLRTLGAGSESRKLEMISSCPISRQ